MYQLFVGEIGITPGTFRYGLKWWEIKSIIRGYNARHHHGWEQARLVAYNAHFCMGSKDTPPTVYQWLPLPWEKQEADLPTSDDISDILAEIDALNAQNKSSEE